MKKIHRATDLGSIYIADDAVKILVDLRNRESLD
ncbi:conserved protein of unknown function [Candidatus Nitrosacidococcus tergens]|uniref:Uncharacterized protein n=1 Tax=Candidatus Nitrosacidococcus tergens TaxID=553981 RepID=A0A7G1Q9D8_9GAMM|nr:conserved protein of unknown function [Candidatus Nitrosacidococcus tergens]